MPLEKGVPHSLEVTSGLCSLVKGFPCLILSCLVARAAGAVFQLPSSPCGLGLVCPGREAVQGHLGFRRIGRGGCLIAGFWGPQRVCRFSGSGAL